MSTKRMHIFFSGSVQGVGFRFATRDIAERIGGITGTVENLPDRRVELIAEGETKLLVEFLGKILEYFANYVRSSNVEWEEATDEYSNFTII